MVAETVLGTAEQDTHGASTRTRVLQLIVGQLQSYGYYQLASIVQEETGIDNTVTPSNGIEEKVLGISGAQDAGADGDAMNMDASEENDQANAVKSEDYNDIKVKSEDVFDNPADRALFEGVEEDNDDEDNARGAESSEDYEVPPLVPYYNTSHRGPSLVASYSVDGKLIATGSADMSIKVIDVDKVKTAYMTNSDFGRPVIRTLYDHSDTINDVQFHPNGTVVASASDDGQIKIFDVLKPNSKKSFRYIQDATQIKTLSFHPSGDFLAVGTLHPFMRIYDVHTLKCYSVPDRKANHTGPINKVQYSRNGKVIVSCSEDGTVRLWDAIGGRCVRVYDSPHNGLAVTSICMAKNGRELLSTGKDGITRLWDLAGGNDALVEYHPSESPETSARDGFVANSNRNAQFTFDGKFVAGTDSSTNTLALWNKQTGEMKRCFRDGPDRMTWVAASPNELAFATCSDDTKVRYWGLS